MHVYVSVCGSAVDSYSTVLPRRIATFIDTTKMAEKSKEKRVIVIGVDHSEFAEKAFDCKYYLKAFSIVHRY